MISHKLVIGGALSSLFLAAPMPAAPAATDTTTLTLNISGMRNQKGNMLICVTKNPNRFPNCSVDPAALKAKIPTRQSGRVVFKAVAPGTWAVAMLHDENANNDLDTTATLPNEGFGFSRNPVVSRSAPKFSAAAVKIGATPAALSIRLQYLM